MDPRMADGIWLAVTKSVTEGLPTVVIVLSSWFSVLSLATGLVNIEFSRESEPGNPQFQLVFSHKFD